MNSLLNLTEKFCKDMHMLLAVSKTFVLTTGPRNRVWRVRGAVEDIRETLMAKYLGVKIQVRGRHLLHREKDMVATARRFAHSIMSLTRAGLDRSHVARTLWEVCAIPAILYATEAMSITRTTVKSVERLQRMVGNFILQTPSSTSKVATWIDAGLMPIQYRIHQRQARYYGRL